MLSLCKDSVAVRGRHVEAVRCPGGRRRVEKVSTSHTHNGAAEDVRNDADTRARNHIKYQEANVDWLMGKTLSPKKGPDETRVDFADTKSLRQIEWLPRLQEISTVSGKKVKD